MKKIINFAVAMLCVVVVLACSEKGDVGEEFLDVTPNNVSGVWSLESYDNGQTLAEGTYYYIDLDRKDRTFVSYDNLGSMEVHKRSGRYDITVDGAAVIRGIYDFGQGDWEHSYYVRNLTKNRMVWVAVDDESIVQVYVRSELPEEFDSEQE
ncbi:MAG: lipocalin family protein [Alistipes sp.]|nr:lipocalin family protein [Alistipes sp.]